MVIHVDSKGSRRESMCSMVWGIRCSRDDANVARNGEEEKREKTPGNWCEESRFPGIAHPRVFWEIFF